MLNIHLDRAIGYWLAFGFDQGRLELDFVSLKKQVISMSINQFVKHKHILAVVILLFREQLFDSPLACQSLSTLRELCTKWILVTFVRNESIRENGGPDGLRANVGAGENRDNDRLQGCANAIQPFTRLLATTERCWRYWAIIWTHHLL